MTSVMLQSSSAFIAYVENGVQRLAPHDYSCIAYNNMDHMALAIFK